MPGKYPGFSVCVENRDGQRVRREFVMIANIVRFAGEQPCEPPVPIDFLKSPTALKTAPEPATPANAPGFFQRAVQRVKRLFAK